MEQEDSLEFLKTFQDEKVVDIDLMEDLTSSMVTIRFSNNESIVIAGDALEIYFAVHKDTDFH